MGFLFPLVFLQQPAAPTGKPKPICSPPENLSIVYEHAKFAPEAEIRRSFRGFEVSFDSNDDDDRNPGGDLLRVPHWVAQEIRRLGASGRGPGRGSCVVSGHAEASAQVVHGR